MWDFFDRTSVKEVKCKLCAKVLVYLGSTSSMREHMKRTHPQKLRPEDGEAKVGVPKTQAINTYFPASSPGAVNPNASRTCSPATAQRITNLIIDGLTADLRPLNLVHDEGFRLLMAYLIPAYVVPSRTCITKIIKRRHEDGKRELGQLLCNEAGVCSLTTDAWSSAASQSYNTVTCHFLDKDWSLVSAVLNTSHFPCSHTAVRIAEKVRQTLSSVQMPEKKVVSIVHDEAANAKAAGNILSEEVGWQSNACAAHLLQTAIKHTIESSPPVQKLLGSARRLVSHFRQSIQATELLLHKEKQMDVQPLKLTQDVSTHWNSSFYSDAASPESSFTAAGCT